LYISKKLTGDKDREKKMNAASFFAKKNSVPGFKHTDSRNLMGNQSKTGGKKRNFDVPVCRLNIEINNPVALAG
jgi:hypothetical protein